jgi:hypothetical protein
MREIRFAGSPLLTLVNLGGENITSPQKVQIPSRLVFLNLFLDVLYSNWDAALKWQLFPLLSEKYTTRRWVLTIQILRACLSPCDLREQMLRNGSRTDNPRGAKGEVQYGRGHSRHWPSVQHQVYRACQLLPNGLCIDGILSS